jgi:hypothetical protein
MSDRIVVALEGARLGLWLHDGRCEPAQHRLLPSHDAKFLSREQTTE